MYLSLSQLIEIHLTLPPRVLGLKERAATPDLEEVFVEGLLCPRQTFGSRLGFYRLDVSSTPPALF